MSLASPANAMHRRGSYRNTSAHSLGSSSLDCSRPLLINNMPRSAFADLSRVLLCCRASSRRTSAVPCRCITPLFSAPALLFSANHSLCAVPHSAPVLCRCRAISGHAVSVAISDPCPCRSTLYSALPLRPLDDASLYKALTPQFKPTQRHAPASQSSVTPCPRPASRVR